MVREERAISSPMINRQLAKIFREMAVLLEMKEVPFKPQAYEKVSYVIETLEEDLSDIYKGLSSRELLRRDKSGLKALENIPGVGTSIAGHIEEYIKTGHIKNYDKLKKEIPVDVGGLKSVEGIGPKIILKLYKKLGIRNLDQLEKAAKTGKIRNIAGLGLRTEEKILKSIGFLRNSSGRLILGFNMPVFRAILEGIREVDGVKKAEFGGSIRRMQETVGDLDILAISTKPSKVMDFFISMPEVDAVHEHGPTH